MNDFLKGIRKSQRPSLQRKQGKKQSGITRKNYDAHNYQSKDRADQIEKQTTIPRFNKNSESISLDNIKDAIPFINEHLSRMASSMERIADIKEILSKEQIKEHREIGKFFENLNMMLVKTVIPALEKDTNFKQKKDEIKQECANCSLDRRNTKEEVLSIIRTMRKNGVTFVAIANHLKKQGIPTFSGRGKWHAQTIHRLYNGHEADLMSPRSALNKE